MQKVVRKIGKKLQVTAANRDRLCGREPQHLRKHASNLQKMGDKHVAEERQEMITQVNSPVRTDKNHEKSA